MGSELPALDLGTDFEPVQLTAGAEFTCALSRRGTVKCWGKAAHLGLGSSSADFIGSRPDEMGDALPTLDLGPGQHMVVLIPAIFLVTKLHAELRLRASM